MKRFVEVYTGAYTSGKSEISINRALSLNKTFPPITLVDLDTVEPAYTLRPIKKDIEALGVKVVTQESYFGLGETGNVLTGYQTNCLLNDGNIVIDVGYGVGGLDVLEIISNIEKEEDLRIYIVINASKPETSSTDEIINYVNWTKGSERRSWKKFSGIISNTHFGDETQKDDVLRGFEVTKKAAEKLSIPIRALCICEELLSEFDSKTISDIEIWSLQRFMPKALW